MKTLNLLIWSEQWRRNDRRRGIIRFGFFLSVMLMLGICGRVYFYKQCHKVERHIDLLKVSLNENTQKQVSLEKILEEQKEKVTMLERKKMWRKRFVCHEALLKKLADILPYSVRVEMIKVRADEWSLLVIAKSEIKLKEFFRKLSSVEGLRQMQVRQINIDGDQVGVQIEFLAKVNC